MGYNVYMTKAGFALQAKLFAQGGELEITKVQVGSGVLPGDADWQGLTELMQPKATATSTAPVRKGCTVSLDVEYRSDLASEMEEPFQINEFGVFALGAEGEEALILYGDLSDCPDTAVPLKYGGCVRRYPVLMEIGPNAGAKLDYPAAAWMTVEEVNSALAAKQDTLAGQPGQVVGFDDSGNAVAQEPAISAAQASYDGSESGLTADTVQAALDALTSSKADVGRVSNPNLLDNGYLADPVNQRRLTTYSGGGYIIDRWKASNGLVVSLEDGYIKLQNDTDQDKFFIQELERDTLKHIAGNKVTMSFLYKGDGFASSFRYQANESYVNMTFRSFEAANDLLIGFMTTFASVPGILPDALQVLVQIMPRTTLRFKAAKLELGPQQTLAHQDADGNWVLNDPPPNKALELAKCQRYQQVLNPGFTCRATIITSGAITFLIPTPVTFRAYPEITGSGSLIVRKTSTENQSGFSFSTTSSGSGYIRITAIKENHGMTDAELFVTGGPIILDANL